MVMRHSRLVLVTLLTLAMTPLEARANGGFRCGDRLVRDGETQDDVSRKCGAPDATREWTETQTETVWVAGRRVERSIPINYAEWKYDFGRHRLMLYVTFVNGRSAHTKTGEYGHR